jgi:hypothetical protein
MKNFQGVSLIRSVRPTPPLIPKELAPAATLPLLTNPLLQLNPNHSQIGSHTVLFGTDVPCEIDTCL